MVLYQVYSHPVLKRYKTSVCSKATLFQIITFAITVICPLLIAYRSQGFWIKISRYNEQPYVQFKYQYIIHVHGDSAEQYYIWSSYPALNVMEQDHVRIPHVKAYQSDFNRDGIADRLDFQATLPMNVDESVHSVKTFLIFDYYLKSYSRFQMETMILVDYQSVLPATGVTVIGDMKLLQRTPLQYRGIDRRFDVAIINGTRLDAEALQYDRIVSEYYSRNLTTRLDPVNAYWTYGPAGATGEFNIKITVNYIEDTVEYRTGFWELIKWAWIQYLSILLIFIFVFKRIRSFIFQNRLLYLIPFEIGQQQNSRRVG